jgi:hypothetical protein
VNPVQPPWRPTSQAHTVAGPGGTPTATPDRTTCWPLLFSGDTLTAGPVTIPHNAAAMQCRSPLVAVSCCCDDGISGAGRCCGCWVSCTRVSSRQQLQLVHWCPDVVQRPYCCLSGCRRWLLPAAVEAGAQAAAAAVVGRCLADVSPASSSCCWFTGAQMPCGGPTAACLAAAGCHKALGPRALVAGLLQSAWG